MAKRESVKFIDCFGLAGDFGFWIKCLEKVEQYLYSKEKQWIAVHYHHRNPGMHWLKYNVTRWKIDLQSHGCQMIATTSFREPVSRLKSYVYFNGIQKDNLSQWIIDYGEGKCQAAQLGYFLWNWYTPNQQLPMKVIEPDEQRLITSMSMIEFWEIIELFDVVGFTENLGEFMDKIEERTKWKPLHSKRRVNITPIRKKYIITDEQEKLMQQATSTELLVYKELKLKFM